MFTIVTLVTYIIKRNRLLKYPFGKSEFLLSQAGIEVRNRKLTLKRLRGSKDFLLYCESFCYCVTMVCPTWHYFTFLFLLGFGKSG